MTQNPWKEIESIENIIHYRNDALPTLVTEVIAVRVKHHKIDNRESWWTIEYLLNGNPEHSLLEKQDKEFFNKTGLTQPYVIKGKKNAIKAIKEFINPKKYRFDILSHQRVPRGYSTNDPDEASRLLRKARVTDPDAVIIDNQDFYPKSEWTW